MIFPLIGNCLNKKLYCYLIFYNIIINNNYCINILYDLKDYDKDIIQYYIIRYKIVHIARIINHFFESAPVR